MRLLASSRVPRPGIQSPGFPSPGGPCPKGVLRLEAKAFTVFFFYNFILNMILPTSWAAFSDQSWSLVLFTRARTPLVKEES